MSEQTIAQHGAAMTSKPSVWYRLGFRYRFDEDLFEWRNKEPPDEGFAVGAIGIRIGVHVSFVDRLRLLISGHAELTAYVKTNVTVDRAKTRSQFAILPPGRI